jgi:peptide/nickel transport system substrate-binding protein
MKRLPFTILSLIIVVSMLLTACGPTPEPEVVVQTVEVEKEVKVIETVEVEKEVTVIETVEVEVPVEVEVEVTAVPEVPAEVTYDRSTTLYTTGTSWGPPSDWNPLTDWSMAMGVEGLLYEQLFLWDPLTDETIPWLAESGGWVDEDTYEIKVREGMTWSDGEPITAADVKLTFELGQQFAALPYSILWEWLGSIEQVDDYTLLFEFSDPLYHQWSRYVSQISIVPAHIWADMTEEEITAGANENPVGSGAYLYDTHGQDRMVWVKNPDWWATELLGLEVVPERIVDLVNRSNNVSLGMILQGDLDWSNNFLPGVKNLVEGGYGIETYLPESPYMLAANTANLWLNLTKPPMDDVAFRSALAHSIDVSQIVNVVYGGIVTAANPVGLLPSEAWIKYLDEDLVAQYGFSYDPEKAEQILADAGYADTDGDGFVEAPDGTPFALKVIVPFGWTDWMESINVIARSAQAVGINLEPEFPDFGGYEDQLYGGTFDMAINNFGSNLSNTPWTYFEWVFRSPIAERMNSGNFGRYENLEAFDLVDQLDKTPLDDKEAVQEVMSALQEIMLQDLPAIPLWYNGAWYQGNTAHWTNLPRDVEGAPHYYPITWNNYVQYGFLLALTEMEPAGE